MLVACSSIRSPQITSQLCGKSFPLQPIYAAWKVNDQKEHQTPQYELLYKIRVEAQGQEYYLYFYTYGRISRQAMLWITKNKGYPQRRYLLSNFAHFRLNTSAKTIFRLAQCQVSNAVSSMTR